MIIKGEIKIIKINFSNLHKLKIAYNILEDVVGEIRNNKYVNDDFKKIFKIKNLLNQVIKNS